ncbi:hypothetical protein KY290_009239 [Solanum tuberosum]|uniref:Retrotransposon Copia-like N-terminal domain-containing protein n=1 Tax=Solanum tuberosum TaxID=4113 RepID=A0ABQ7WAV9_SOLTU|nr:hypothetical protein KY290_009239 [Solanum tuberosum]
MGDNTDDSTNPKAFNTGIEDPNKIDVSHPYYLSTSDAPGFINGSCPEPLKGSNMLKQWIHCNDMVIAWLLNSLNTEIAESVIYSQTAADLWNELEERYGQADGTKLFQLQRELNNMSQGVSDVASCDAKGHNQNIIKDQKLIQFLMGLNNSFNVAKGNILMMGPLSNATHAYSIILLQETQKEVHSNHQISTDSSAFMTGQKWTSQKKPMDCKGINQCQGKKSDMYCRYCKKSRHENEQCYKLVGQLIPTYREVAQMLQFLNQMQLQTWLAPLLIKGQAFGDASTDLYLLEDKPWLLQDKSDKSSAPMSSFIDFPQSSGEPVLRKSQREHHRPMFLSDYIRNAAFSDFLPNPPCLPIYSFYFSALTQDNQRLVTSICQIQEPNSYHQAIQHPGWQSAMEQEFTALDSNHTWDVVPLPAGKKALSCKWVYKVKLKSDGSLEQLKARFVVH